MSTVKISALPTMGGGTVDRTADFIPIVDTSLTVTDKVTPNNLLGITGSPVGTSDSQTLTNKIITSPTISGPTLSGTLIGTYTIGGTPTFPASVVTLTGSQTLTNKTLTSPIITGGSIDNTTITVDSISGHTSGTIVTVGGVQMNNGVIGTTGAVVTNSIAAGAVVPNSLLASTGTGWAFSTWAPSWTNLTVGNGTVVARWVQVGKTAFGYVAFTFGTTSAISGDVSFTLPFTANAAYLTDHPAGTARLVDSGVQGYPAELYLTSTTKLRLSISSVGATYPTDTPLSSTVPFSWGTADFFTLTFAGIEVA